jgi:RNA polymerase sigma-70 factor (ECF subfamily)
MNDIKKELNMDDNKIIELYWKRSESAISETANKYTKYCQYISFNILHNNEDVEECINETYLRLWHVIPPKYPENLSTFLGKIIRSISINKLKHYSAKKRGKGNVELLLSELEECIPSENNVEKTIEKKFLVEIINDFLSELPRIKRIIFVHRYWYVSSIREIAKEYNMTESKVKSMLFRVRKQFKNYLEKRGIIL